jgi:hypothetical protein
MGRNLSNPEALHDLHWERSAIQMLELLEEATWDDIRVDEIEENEDDTESRTY